MAVDAISTDSTAARATGFSALSSEDFAQIIFTELSKQDPLAPNDTNALIQQISGIRSIQSNMDLSSKLNSLVSQNEFSAAATMLGKSVSGVSLEAARVEGIVRSVAQTSEGALLTLADGSRVLMSQVDEVQTPEAAG